MSNQEPDLEVIEQLRARADQAAQLERSNSLKDAEIAVLKAGVPTGTRIGQAFLEDLSKRDDVDFQSSEAIHKAAEEWGLWQPEGSEPREDPAQKQAQETRNLLQQGAAPDAAPPPPPDPITEGWANFKTRVYEQGARREDAAAEVIDRLITAAVKGDERAVVRVQSTPYGSMQRTSATEGIPFVAGREK